MGKVIYSFAMSLDGFIAGPKGEYDWIPVDDSIDWSEYMGRFDAVLMGRHTYDILAAQDSETLFPDKEVYVFSRTIKSTDYQNVTVLPEVNKEFVNKLKESTERDIWLMGGGRLFQSLLAKNLVDNIEIAVVPILLGKGITGFPDSQIRRSLQLIRAIQYKSGIHLLYYKIIKS